MGSQRIYQALDRSCRLFCCHVVAVRDFARNVSCCLTALKTAPYEHCCLIERVVTLGIQIDEHCFTAVELGIDNVAVWMWCGGGVQAILFSNLNQSLVVAGATITGNERPLTA